MTTELTPELVNQVKHIAKEAGAAIMNIYSQEIEVVSKADDSPLTQADLASHHVICEGLAKISDLPILSEESVKIDWAERQSWDRYWLIDPLDGTKEFIKRNGEFTVNIALIENHQPVFGVVYAPVLETTYWGAVGQGAYREIAGEETRINLTSPENLENLKVVGSRSHVSPDMESFLADFVNPEIVPKGSSLKLCMVAEGSADIYPRLGLTSEWDTGAGHAVVSAAGGIVCKTDGSDLLYNAEEDILNPYFLVLSKSLYAQLFSS